MREHQEKIPYIYIRDKFKSMEIQDFKFSEGVTYDEQRHVIILKMMDIEYHVAYPSGEVFTHLGQKVDSYVLKTILLRYLVNGKGTKAYGQFITYKELQDGQLYYPNFYKRTILRLAKIFDKHQEIFCHPIIKKDIKDGADCSFSFQFLPNIIFKFILYRGDEEFSASANILMDRNTEDYFNAEDLAVVVDVAIEFFVHKGSIPLDLGMYQFN